MALTFRSSIPDEVVLIDRDNAGNQRVLRAISVAESNNSNRGQWRCYLEEPVAGGGSVKKELGNVYGERSEAAIGLVDIMHRTETDWKKNRARGFMPEPRKRDVNVPVDDAGNYRNAQIKPRS